VPTGHPIQHQRGDVAPRSRSTPRHHTGPDQLPRRQQRKSSHTTRPGASVEPASQAPHPQHAHRSRHAGYRQSTPSRPACPIGLSKHTNTRGRENLYRNGIAHQRRRENQCRITKRALSTPPRMRTSMTASDGAVSGDRLAEISTSPAPTASDPALDTLILRPHTKPHDDQSTLACRPYNRSARTTFRGHAASIGAQCRAPLSSADLIGHRSPAVRR